MTEINAHVDSHRWRMTLSMST